MANNKGSLQLFKLIKALTPSEKAYFKKYARQYVPLGTEYFRLFEALEKMKTYDDGILKNQFKNLSYVKNYLFNLLLDVLTNYYNNPRHSNIYLSSLYIKSAILEYKGFSAQAIKELARGVKLARRQSDYLAQYLFLSPLYRLQAANIDVSNRLKYVEQANADLKNLLQKETGYLQHRLEFTKLILYATQKTQGFLWPLTNPDIDFKLIEEIPPQAGLVERRSYYEALLAWYMSEGNFQKIYPLAHSYLKEERKHLKTPGNDFYNYGQALAFCIVACTEMRKYNEAEKHLEALRRINSPNARVNNDNLSRYVAYKTIIYSASKQFSKGALFVHTARSRYAEQFNPKATGRYYNPLICYSLYILFSNKNYDDCISLLNEANIPYIRKNALHTYKDMEMMRLMIQAELGNYKLLPNLVRSASLKLKKYGIEGPYEKCLFHFFKRLPKSGWGMQKKNTIQSLVTMADTKPDIYPRYLFMGVMFYHDWIKQYTATTA